MNKCFKGQKIEKRFLEQIARLEDQFNEMSNNEHYVYTFASVFPKKLSELLKHQKVQVSSMKLIDSLVMKLLSYLDEKSGANLIINMIEVGFFDQLSDLFYFNDHVDTYIRLTTVFNPRSVLDNNGVSASTLDETIMKTTEDIFRFGSGREIKQFLPKFIEFLCRFTSASCCRVSVG